MNRKTMRFDYAQYAHPGNAPGGRDAVCLWADDELFAAVICDGLGGPDAGETVATFCADLIATEHARGLVHAFLHTHTALRERQNREPALVTARSTAAALTLSPVSGVLRWASVGDSRIYVFANGTVAAISPDDSAGYAAYLRGETDHEGVRLFDARDCLTASLGGEREPDVHEGTLSLTPGDAVLVCSDGFWEYVFDLEMQIDLQKSTSAEEWLRLMLLRLTQRSCLAGDALSAVACMVVG
jgi:serine/threonine protein phosphatase PrpC